MLVSSSAPSARASHCTPSEREGGGWSPRPRALSSRRARPGLCTTDGDFERTHLPVIVDPSHGTGRRSYVAPMAWAARAAGAHGLLVEVHPEPEKALPDGDQSLDFAEFAALMARPRFGPAPGIEHVAAHLPSGVVLAAYALYQRRVDHPRPGRSQRDEAYVPSYLAFIHHRDGRSFLVDLGPASEMDACVATWKAEASRAPREKDASDLVRYFRVGEDLRRRAWDPLKVHFGNARGVFLVPDGSLNLVNFAALPSGDGYLIDHGPLLHYLSAERDLTLPAREAVDADLLALGGPEFDEVAWPSGIEAVRQDLHARSTDGADTAGHPNPSSRPYRAAPSDCPNFRSLRFLRLPGAATEARELLELWRRSTVERQVNGRITGGRVAPASPRGILLTGPLASEAAFKTLAVGPTILHLATHGFFLGSDCAFPATSSRGVGAFRARTRPDPGGENLFLLSGLALAGANRRNGPSSDGEDGILTADEIASMDLSRLEWAVLSACDTGLGRIESGEGVFGLRRAFKAAGARALIMSLWSVDDQSARIWMRALYEARFVEGRGTAEAVQAATRRTLRERRHTGRSTHPFYWAGFIAAGDWR